MKKNNIIRDTASVNNFSLVIKQFRIEKNWSQKHAANLFDLSPSTLSSIESGISMPRYKVFLKIAEVFNITDIYLMLCSYPYFSIQPKLSSVVIVSDGIYTFKHKQVLSKRQYRKLLVVLGRKRRFSRKGK